MKTLLNTLITKDLSPLEANAIIRISESSGMTMTTLAREIGCSTATVTGLIDRLEKRGFCRRKPSTKDRRSITILLTIQGKKLAQELNGGEA